MGNVSNIEKIDLSLNNIWRSWFLFRRGKRKIKELEFFQYYLEENLGRLYEELNKNIYRHGSYQYFVIQEKKRRHIAVAQIRDRVVHRLVYEYLVKLYDPIFIYDIWSCRKNKGLLGAIERTQKIFKKYPRSFVWRADITKFFDNVNVATLYEIVCRRVKDENARRLLKIILDSYNGRCEREREREEQTSAAFPLAI